MSLILDADKPFLEQLEELALSDDEAYELLTQKIFRNPERLYLLESLRLTNTNDLAPPQGEASYPTTECQIGMPEKPCDVPAYQYGKSTAHEDPTKPE